MPIPPKDLRRHLFHALGGMTLPASYLFLEKPLMAVFACLLATLVFSFDLIRLRSSPLNALFLSKLPVTLKKKEETSVTGSTYLLLGSALTILLFPKPIAILAMSYLAIGDASAALIGRTFGLHKILKGTKSIEGSIGCFLACSAIGLLLGLAWFQVPIPLILLGALVTTVTELFNSRIDDNLSIPLVAATAMWGLQRIL